MKIYVMKTFQILRLWGLLMYSGGILLVKGQNTQKSNVLEIHFQSYFYHDTVSLYIGNEHIFTDYDVVTIPTLGFTFLGVVLDYKDDYKVTMPSKAPNNISVFHLKSDETKQRISNDKILPLTIEVNGHSFDYLIPIEKVKLIGIEKAKCYGFSGVVGGSKCPTLLRYKTFDYVPKYR